MTSDAPFTPRELVALLAGVGAAELLPHVGTADPAARELLLLSGHREALEVASALLARARAGGSTPRSPSPYQAALAAGLDDLVTTFLGAVADVEVEALQDPSLTSHHVRYALRTYAAVLPRVASFVGGVVKGDVRGPRLLSALSAAAQDGDPAVASAFAALLFRVHQPFFAHVARWMAYGELDGDGEGGGADADADADADAGGNVWAAGAEGGHAVHPSLRRGASGVSSAAAMSDFFIVRSSTAAASASVLASNVVDGATKRSGGGAAGAGSADAARPELRLLAGSGISDALIGAGCVHPSPDADAAAALTAAQREADWSRSAVLRVDGGAAATTSSSSYLPEGLAETVLAVGKAVGLLRQHAGGTREGPGAAAGSTGTVARRGPEKGRRAPAGPTRPPPGAEGGGEADDGADAGGDEAAGAGEGDEDIPIPTSLAHHHPSPSFAREDSLAIAQVLHALRSSPRLTLLATQTVIHRIRDSVYGRLWRLLVADGDVLAHVASVRSFFLLGRGDLFQAFLEHSRRMMTATPATSASALQQLLAGPWDAAAAQAQLRLAGAGEGAGADDEGGSAREDGDADRRGFRRVSLRLAFRALRFEATPPRVMLSPAGGRTTGAGDGLGDGGSVAASSLDAGGANTRGYAGSTARMTGTGAGPFAAAAAVAAAALMPPTAALLRAWNTCSLVGADRLVRTPRVPAPLVVLGTAGVVPVLLASEQPQAGKGVPGGPNAALDETVALSVAPDGPVVCDKLCLALPVHAAPAAASASRSVSRGAMTGAGGGPAGAVWVQQTVAVTRGVALKGAVSFAAAETASPIVSFAVVLQRDHALALGMPGGASAAAPLASSGAAAGAQGSGADGGGGGGYAGIANSLAIHVLCKRLPQGAAGPARPPSYRVVVAVYGAPGSRRGGGGAGAGAAVVDPSGRPLLASGVVLETQLVPEPAYVLPDGSAAQGVRLHFAVEYTPASANLDGGGGGGGSSGGGPVGADPATAALSRAAGVGKGRLRVSILDASLLAGAAAGAVPSSSSFSGLPSRRSSVASATAAAAPPAAALVPSRVAEAAKVALDCPLTLEDCMNFVGVYGPGRGRAWIGLTAESPVGVVGAAAARSPASAHLGPPPLPPPPSSPVHLEYFDVLSYSDADDGYAGLHPTYDVPAPLHVVLHAGALSVYGDVFRFGLRAKAVALGLEEVRRTLVGARALGGPPASAAAAAATTAPSSNAGSGPRALPSSAQLSGVGGKRSAAQSEALRTRLALQRRLHPLWLLRARMQYVVDALLYHLQVDVIESAHAAFREAVASARDYGALQAAHESFLRALQEGAFLTQPSVHACIGRLLNHCERLVVVANGTAAGTGAALAALADSVAAAGSLPATAGSTPLGDLSASFEADVRFLEAAAGAERVALRGADSRSLLMRLNYSGYFIG
jgi:hypothetical protein